MRFVHALIAAAFLAGCATATPYQPSANGYGFAESPIEANRLRVSFRGNSLTDRETVETYLLFRAAEATVERGYDYFITADRDTEAQTRLYADPSPYPRFSPAYWFYSPYYGWRARYYHDPFFHDPFWDREYRAVTRYEAVAEIAMFRGAKPADNENAYDAREVIANLQSRVVRPPAT